MYLWTDRHLTIKTEDILWLIWMLVTHWTICRVATCIDCYFSCRGGGGVIHTQLNQRRADIIHPATLDQSITRQLLATVRTLLPRRQPVRDAAVAEELWTLVTQVRVLGLCWIRVLSVIFTHVVILLFTLLTPPNFLPYKPNIRMYSVDFPFSNSLSLSEQVNRG